MVRIAQKIECQKHDEATHESRACRNEADPHDHVPENFAQLCVGPKLSAHNRR